MLPGEHLLPSIRKLATMIDVNPNTVAKAYQELERQHIIVTVRGRGTFVEDNPSLNGSGNMDDFKAAFKAPVAEMLLSGVSEEEILDCVRSVINELNTGKGE